MTEQNSEVDKILQKYDLDSPDSIYVKKGDQEYVLAEGRIRELTSKFIELCNSEATTQHDFGMNSKVVGMLIDIKKVWWPATQKSLTANVDFDKQLDKWFVTQKELLEVEKKKGNVIVEVIPDAR